jgi:hypothetical protein
MGCKESKNNLIPTEIGKSLSNTEFVSLKISSMFVELDDSINKNRKINTLIEFFIKSYSKRDLDILCVQGIRKYKILCEVIEKFKKSIENFNDSKSKLYNKNRNKKISKLYYYPDIVTPCNFNSEKGWNTTQLDNENKFFDKLIISKYELLQSSNAELGEDVLNEFKYVQFVNININGIFISVYNIELTEDNLGVDNSKERTREISNIIKITEINREMSKETSMRKYLNGNDLHVAEYYDVHIFAGLFNIPEIRDNVYNYEYLNMINSLEVIDCHRLIKVMKNNKSNLVSNSRYTKNSYILLNSIDIFDDKDIKNIFSKIYKNNKVIIRNANILDNYVDMSTFSNYPLETHFSLKKLDKCKYIEEKFNTDDSNIVEPIKIVESREMKDENTLCSAFIDICDYDSSDDVIIETDILEELMRLGYQKKIDN